MLERTKLTRNCDKDNKILLPCNRCE